MMDWNGFLLRLRQIDARSFWIEVAVLVACVAAAWGVSRWFGRDQPRDSVSFGERTFDGLLFPLVYEKFDTALTAEAGPTVSMLLRFQNEWFTETSKWIDSTLKTAAAESAANTELLNGWVSSWRDRAVKALAPVADLALGGDAAASLTDVVNTFNARAAKCGLSV